MTASPTADASRTPEATAAASSAAASDPNTLVSGTPVTVVVKRDVKLTWIFLGSAGQLVEVRADRDPSGNVSPGLEITAPDGSVVSSQYTGGGYLRIATRIQQTGTFRVTLDGRGGSGGATVRLALDPYVPIASGTTTNATLALPDEIDRYTFDGSPGQFVEVRMVRDAASPVSPRFRLLNPFGQQLIDDYSSSGKGYLVKTARLSDKGVFRLEVSSHDAGATGAYTIEVNIDPFIALTLGSVVNGTLSKPVQRDRYRFACVTGQRIDFSIQADPAGNVEPFYNLVDPFGNGVANGYKSGQVTQASATCRFTGAYVLEVGAHGETEHGAYTLAAR